MLLLTGLDWKRYSPVNSTIVASFTSKRPWNQVSCSFRAVGKHVAIDKVSLDFLLDKISHKYTYTRTRTHARTHAHLRWTKTALHSSYHLLCNMRKYMYK